MPARPKIKVRISPALRRRVYARFSDDLRQSSIATISGFPHVTGLSRQLVTRSPKPKEIASVGYASRRSSGTRAIRLWIHYRSSRRCPVRTEPLINVRQLAELLNVRPKWIYADCESATGTLPFRRIGRFLRFDKASIEAWLDKQSGR